MKLFIFLTSEYEERYIIMSENFETAQNDLIYWASIQDSMNFGPHNYNMDSVMDAIEYAKNKIVLEYDPGEVIVRSN